MEQKWADVISEELCVKPIMINSALVCAAERKRLYWTNIPGIEQPKDKGIILKDIVCLPEEVPEKYWYKKPFTYNGDDCKVQATLEVNSQRHTKEVYNLNSKCNTLLCVQGGYQEKKVFQDGRCRKLMPIEYERLQTLPDNYTDGVSDSRRYTAIGNGWTVDVIAHIFTYLKKEIEKEKEMELKMQEYKLPELLSWNYEEVKQWAIEGTELYTKLIYSDDQMTELKKKKAEFNKAKKALNDERIRREREYNKPFVAFKEQVNEVIGIIDKAISFMDKQQKGYEEQKKAEKKEKIIELYKNTVFPDWVKFEQIFDARWLNSSVSMAAITKELIARLEQIENDLAALSSLPEFGLEAVDVYKTTFDINRALNEGKRLAEIQKRKAEAERIAAERKAEEEAQKQQEEQLPGQISFTDAESFENNCIVPKAEEKPFEECMNPPIEEREWVGFKAYITEKEAVELANFFKTRDIQYEAIEI